jgi:hypothetical protein
LRKKWNPTAAGRLNRRRRPEGLCHRPEGLCQSIFRKKPAPGLDHKRVHSISPRRRASPPLCLRRAMGGNRFSVRKCDKRDKTRAHSVSLETECALVARPLVIDGHGDAGGSSSGSPWMHQAWHPTVRSIRSRRFAYREPISITPPAPIRSRRPSTPLTSAQCSQQKNVPSFSSP